MADPTAVKALCDRVGFGMMNCAHALDICAGDDLLAEGYLKHNGLAVCIHDEHGNPSRTAYKRWVMEEALRWKAQHLLSLPPVDLVAFWPADCMVPLFADPSLTTRAELERRLDHNNRAYLLVHGAGAVTGAQP